MHHKILTLIFAIFNNPKNKVTQNNHNNNRVCCACLIYQNNYEYLKKETTNIYQEASFSF